MASPESTQENASSHRQGMLATNDLVYTLPPDLSVTVVRTHKSHFAQSNEYTDKQRAIIIINSGADYGDMLHSSLEFSITLEGAADIGAYLGKNGSIMNIFRSVTVSSRSGDEVSRTIDRNHLSNMTNGFMYSKDWIETVGQGMLYGGCLMPTVVSANGSTKGLVTQHVSVPFYCLCELFGYKKQLPAMLMAGMRLEFEFEDPAIAFQEFNILSNTPVTTQSITGYTIKDMFASISSCQLTDGTQRALNEMSATNGLEILFCDYARTENLIGAADVIHMQAKKSASRVLQGLVSVRDQTNATGFAHDSFASLPFGYDQWQWQLGSLYFPQQPIKALNGATVNSSRNAVCQTYKHTLRAFNTYRCDKNKTSAVPLRDTGNYLETPLAYEIPINGDDETTLALGAGTGTFNPSIGDCLQVGDKVVCEGSYFTVTGVTTPGTIYTFAPVAAITASTTWSKVNRITATPLFAGGNDTNYGSNYFQESNCRLSRPVNCEGRDGSFANGRATVCTLLERSDLFNLSGTPTNNARELSFHATFNATQTGINKVATIYQKYVRLCRVWLNNCELEN